MTLTHFSLKAHTRPVAGAQRSGMNQIYVMTVTVYTRRGLEMDLIQSRLVTSAQFSNTIEPA